MSPSAEHARRTKTCLFARFVVVIHAAGRAFYAVAPIGAIRVVVTNGTGRAFYTVACLFARRADVAGNAGCAFCAVTGFLTRGVEADTHNALPFCSFGAISGFAILSSCHLLAKWQ